MTRQVVSRLASAPVLHCWNASALWSPAAATWLVSKPLGPAGGVAVAAEDPVEEQGEDQDDDAADAAAHDHAARRTATAAAATRTCEVSSVTLSLKLMGGLRGRVRGPRAARRHLD